jgi:hypothetical protein
MADSLVDHAWLSHSVVCAFTRLFLEGDVSTSDERWTNVHILHRYGINRYHYNMPGSDLPRHR